MPKSRSTSNEPADRVLNYELHDEIARRTLSQLGFSDSEIDSATSHCRRATKNAVFSHGLLKLNHLLHHLLMNNEQGCVGQRKIRVVNDRFPAVQVWDAQGKLGIPVAEKAMAKAVRLAKKYGAGRVAVHNVGHYLWGGDYVLQAAKKGMIASTYCTAALAEVLPYSGQTPTLGTNPFSLAFPTKDILGFPVLIDFATSASSMGKIQALARQGKKLPPNTAVDEKGKETLNPEKVKALFTFGGYKGYGLSVFIELLAAFVGGSLPTLRCKWTEGEKSEHHTSTFFFEAIHPDALSAGGFACNRNQSENVLAVITDILGHGNSQARMPGYSKWLARERCKKNGGLVMPLLEIEKLAELAKTVGVSFWPLNCSEAE